MKKTRLHRFPIHTLMLFLGLAVLLVGCAQPTPAADPGEPFGPQPLPLADAPVASRPSPPSEPAPHPPSGDAMAKLAIAYTNDTRGYLDPCG